MNQTLRPTQPAKVSYTKSFKNLHAQKGVSLSEREVNSKEYTTHYG